MSYSSSDDITKAYNAFYVVDSADDDKNGSADDGVIAAIIDEGDGHFASYICGRYPHLTPDYTGTMPPVIRRKHALWCALRLPVRQGMNPSPAMDEINQWLSDVAEGKAVIVGHQDSDLAVSTTHGVKTEFSIKALDEMGEPGTSYMDDGDENNPND